MKIKKRKKSSRRLGRRMGTSGYGARKKHKKSGHRGGKGMSGSGKRADHKKTLITKLYGHKYFGKQGITSRGTKRDKRKRINLQDITANLEKYGKKSVDGWKIELPGYKILGSSKEYMPKDKLIIKANDSSKSAKRKVEERGGEIILIHSSKLGQTKAKEASKSAIEKIKEAGGEIILSNKKEIKKEK